VVYEGTKTILFSSLSGYKEAKITHSIVLEKTRKGERLVFFILLFLDEKKQKSSDYIIC
jgi:hypothetical protein